MPAGDPVRQPPPAAYRARVRTSLVAGAAVLVVASLVAGCSEDEPAPVPVPVVDGAPLDLDDAVLAGYAAEEYDDAWLCGTLPPEIADPVLAGTGELDGYSSFPGTCLVTSIRDDGEQPVVLDVTSSGATELVPAQTRGVLGERAGVELPGGVEGWVVEVPAFRGSAPGAYARAVGRTTAGEPRDVGVHLAPGTRGRDVVADAEVLLRYYVMRVDLAAPLVGGAASDR